MRALVRHARELAASSFDWAVLLPDSVHVALAPWLARVPVRAGYARDLLRRALLTYALAPPRAEGKRLPISMIERYLRITRALGCADAGIELDLPLDAQAVERVAKRLALAGVRRVGAARRRHARRELRREQALAARALRRGLRRPARRRADCARSWRRGPARSPWRTRSRRAPARRRSCSKRR